MDQKSFVPKKVRYETSKQKRVNLMTYRNIMIAYFTPKLSNQSPPHFVFYGKTCSIVIVS